MGRKLLTSFCWVFLNVELVLCVNILVYVIFSVVNNTVNLNKNGFPYLKLNSCAKGFIILNCCQKCSVTRDT